MSKAHLDVRTVIISDVHLGTAHCKVEEVTHFLKYVRCDRLILNGDIIDGWRLQRGDVWTKAHTRFIRRVLTMMQKRDTEVIYLRGNHDDFLGRLLPMQFDRLSLVEDYVLESSSGKYLVLHGDVFDGVIKNMVFLAHLGDLGYNLLLRLNRGYNWFRALRGKEYFSLSQAIKARVKQAVSFVGKFEDQLASLARDRGCSGVICGHIHAPADKMLGDIHYLNSGDWVESMTAVVEHFDGKFELLTFRQFTTQFPMSRDAAFSSDAIDLPLTFRRSPDMAKVLILTAGYGEGHNSAARAVLEAFNERPGIEAELVDVFALRAPRLNHISRKGYVRLINSAPKIWSWFYRWLDRSPFVPHLFRLLGSHRRLLARIIAEKRPIAVVSTYPVYAWLLNQLQREGKLRCPQYTVITDALTINSLWYRARSDAWFVTDPDSAAFLVGKGIPATKVHVSGFPVALGFADRPVNQHPPAPGIGTKFRVLFMINSKRSMALRIARELMLHRDWHITITAGRDEPLQQALQIMAGKSPASVEILGWTSRIPELLMTHHIVISKAGGATTQESINALCPLLVSQIVPGQEEGNYELIRRNEAGALAETPDAIIATLEHALAHDAAQWRRWRFNLKRIAQPAAARKITETILTLRTNPSNAPLAISRIRGPIVSV